MTTKTINTEDSTIMINDIKNLKLLLHRNFYNNINNINKLCTLIENSLNIFNLSYNENLRCIEIKIKKTSLNIKNDETLLDYYYNEFNLIFMEFFKQNIQYISHINNSNLNLEYLYDIRTISSLYNLVIVFDNILHLYL